MKLIRALAAPLIVLTLGWTSAAHAASAQAEAYLRAEELRRAGDVSAARSATRGVGAEIVEWALLRDGKGSFDDYRRFLARNADWPGLPLLAQKGEAAIGPADDPAAVIDYFAAYPPQTGDGVVALMEAYEAKGRTVDARDLAVSAWQSLTLNANAEARLVTRYGSALAPYHDARADALAWDHNFISAARNAARLSQGARALLEAREALASDAAGVDGAIARVPESLQNAGGLAYERFLWRMRKGRYADASALIIAQSSSAKALGNPEAWADKRRALARQMMRDGKGETAYAVASKHFLSEGGSYADLEWLAGYISLRYLNNPAQALDHFNRLRMGVATPISLGRAGYWEGRALEALGATADAKAAYAFAARYQTSFYGLLAAERAGLPFDPQLTGEGSFPDYRGAAFMNSSVTQAALLLHDAGDLPQSARFLRHLGESLSPDALRQLGDLGLSLDPYTALLVAKFAADQGIVLNRAYYPLHPVGDTKLPVEPALTLAISRRESEFYAAAQSGVGARGLMQLMPGTAEMMAKELGISDFSVGQLTRDTALNARLGSAYLAHLIEEFGNNPVLVAAAYNAGPSRVRSWIETYGDPRGATVDPIDWIEHIPFRETRNYVQRVVESLPVYRARLSGQAGVLDLTREMAAR
ncbi:Soluble lytic murein transglycosylase precursor [Aquimixticola soesokkakensis]|uniref:Soluble lytic murein transglycosylase n=2 Tax=Aquimixticola soesokkakensis TaxID=1519096 RepID=A0A1Y5RGS0_9RHOB|nr:Soluble lytic murein transglycosylase precursor [Aquimixticola soesokkakensis]